ncbi:uncharacterized MFS-type transporter C530.15c [Aspergillus lentulus]|uniref:Uncharacterized MFS-type transporter C530.15c n=2 Tax=Aspergillus lentulus TaxID=293939 RepID=A0ABQ1B1W3_ASPLE|nr:uncharacterized MFS-type transporter C530.15c [Aspergillus lentulus]
MAHQQVPKSLSFWRLLLDHSALTQEVLNHDYAGSGTESDPYIVRWLDRDPRNPINFPIRWKVMITLSTAFATLMVSLSSSAYVGSIQGVIEEFHVSKTVATLGLSLFVLGFSVGPLVWAPLSEQVGRQIPFFVSFLCLSSFTAGCAGARNIETLLVLRFFAGPALGPMIGGFLGMNAGWRWVQGLLAASLGLAWIVMALSVPETYAPVLLRKRAKALSTITGDCYRSTLDITRGNISVRSRFQAVVLRPWTLLLREPIVLLLAFYAAVIYGTLYMLFAAFPIVYEEQRGWNPGVGGLPFLGVMVGTLLGALYTLYDNKRFVKVEQQCNGRAPPEARLPPCMVSAVSIPIGLFWFAWTNYPSIHWMASVASLVPFGFGLILVYLGIVNYLIDSYTSFAASALAGMSILRYLFGAVFPLFTTYMYEGLGIHWASSIPAFISVLCMPLPFLFYKYGPTIREHCKYAAISQQQLRQLQAVVGDTQPGPPVREAV